MLRSLESLDPSNIQQGHQGLCISVTSLDDQLSNQSRIALAHVITFAFKACMKFFVAFLIVLDKVGPSTSVKTMIMDSTALIEVFWKREEYLPSYDLPSQRPTSIDTFWAIVLNRQSALRTRRCESKLIRTDSTTNKSNALQEDKHINKAEEDNNKNFHFGSRHLDYCLFL